LTRMHLTRTIRSMTTTSTAPTTPALTINHARMSQVLPSATLAMAAKAKALMKSGAKVCNLSAGEPDFATPACITDAIAPLLQQRAQHAYTNSRGTDELIEATRHKLQRDNHVAYAADEVIATVGTKGGLMLAIDALVGPGDEVVIFAPYWVTYADLVRLAGGTPRIVHTRAQDGYVPTVEQLREALTPKTKLVLLNSPNNPTGAGWPRALLEAMMREIQTTNAWVISDEIYERLVYNGFAHASPASFSADARARTLYVGGVAKAYAMTGWRVGIAAGPKQVIDAMLTLQQQRTTCPTALAQTAAAFALRENNDVTAAVKHMHAAYTTRRKLILERIARIDGLRVHPPQGAFYVLVDVSQRYGKRFQDDVTLVDALLQEKHVATVMGSAFAAPGCIRMSYATTEDTINEAFDRIDSFLRST
jgi:aspartate aminotransferase